MVDLQSALRLAYPRDVLLEEEEEEEEEGAASCIASHLCLCLQLFLVQLQMVDPQLALRRVSPGPSRLGAAVRGRSLHNRFPLRICLLPP